MCRDDKGIILHTKKSIGDTPVLVAEVVAMRERLKVATQAKMEI